MQVFNIVTGKGQLPIDGAKVYQGASVTYMTRYTGCARFTHRYIGSRIGP